ncbi:MAG TPA: thioesterase family protein [Acidimicrobiales bacterium]
MTAPSSFDRATAVALRRGEPGRPAAYDVTVDPDWAIGDKPHGGYLLATLGRAAVAAASAVEAPVHEHPLTASAHYVSAAVPGPAEVHAEVLRRGRRMSQVRARLVQDDAVRVEATFTLGRLAADAEPWWGDLTVPAATPPESCARSPESGATGMVLPIMRHVDVRLDPAVNGFLAGRPTGRPVVQGWFRFADDRPPDPLALLLAVDILPPATFELVMSGWVPTLELTAYVRAVPAPGPLLVRHRARHVESDLVDEVCEVWDARGSLVAQATQLAGLRVDGAEPFRPADEPPAEESPAEPGER